MPPLRDDEGIRGEQNLLRALPPYWLVVKGGRQRPTSDSLLDSNFENSCFVEDELSIAELQVRFPECRFARIPVRVVRIAGFIVERRPAEAPEGIAAPNAHVVIGPPIALARGDYERAARTIVKHPDVSIV